MRTINIMDSSDDIVPPIKSMLIDEQNNIWIATAFFGLRKYEPDIDKLTSFINQPSNNIGISANNLQVLCWDDEMNLLIGTNQDGLVHFDRKLNQFKQFKNDPNDQFSISENMVNAIFKDKQNRIWVGTRNGFLEQFDLKRSKFLHRLSKESHNFEIPKSINDISQDESGDLWLACKGGGIIQFNPETGFKKQYLNKDGLPSNSIFKIVVDETNNLWMNHSQGICYFDRKTEEFTNYDYFSGIPIREFNRNGLIIRANNDICAGGIDGYISFSPINIRINTHVPPVLINNFKLFNKNVNVGDETGILLKSIDETEAITLKYDQSRFTLDFVALNYLNSEHNKYAYKLTGLEKNWNYVENERSASFSTLKPGEYTFHVIASNNDGIWNKVGKKIAISILPPWWRTIWAYSFYVIFSLAVFGLITGYVLYRQNMKNKLRFKTLENEKEKEFSELRLRFYANISHEFFTPLSLISAPLELMMSRTKHDRFFSKNLKYIQTNTKRLIQLVSQLLEFRKLETGNLILKIQKIDLVPFLMVIFDSFKLMARDNDIEYEIEFPDESCYIWADRIQLEHVFYNLLSNAFKYTPDGRVITLKIQKVKIKNRENQICISIKDTGSGISEENIHQIFNRFYQVSSTEPKGQSGVGIGLSFAKTIIDLHCGSIEVESKPNEGTDFKVFFELGKSHFKDLDDIEFLSQSENVDYKIDSMQEYDEIYWGDESEDFSDKSKKNRLLLVEDNKELSKFLKDYLSHHYNVETAFNGEDGVKMVNKNKPDIIISDIMMPVMDGLEFCQILKKSNDFKDIPIILLTAKISEEDIKKGLTAGAEDYIMKPFIPEIVKIKVDNIIKRTSLLKDKYSEEILLPVKDRALESADEKILRKIITFIEQEINNPDLTVEMIYKEVGLSKSKMYRKIKEATDKSPVQFLRYMKIRTAVKYLEGGKLSVSEVAYRVGFQDLPYFRTCFKKEMKKLPSDYLKNN